MLNINVETKIIIDGTLVQYHIYSEDKPLIITFAPAGSVLTYKQIRKDHSAWGFEFFKNRGYNILSFSAIEEKHWFISPILLRYINSLEKQTLLFPQRIGYGASMGAFGLSLYHKSLHIDKLLLITPLTPNDKNIEHLSFDYCAGHHGDITIIYDPFCHQDTLHAMRYPKNSQYLKLYGVGHRVIESMNQLSMLKHTIRDFIVGQIDTENFYRSAKKRKNIERYYSYLLRNPTNKLTKKRINIIKYHAVKLYLTHPYHTLGKPIKKWIKSLKKRL
ncbi:hypothetical protein [Photobacterium damselae]|uniref:hypothetical protein n=1 Tax=Photobacterium damselae TaxID=38293 RepID=UPI000D662FC1|nr:hypothetical protein [Photobacterium damselae]AWK84089.1 hypothetical protein BST98_19085 [Photobacterium damselae]